MKKHNWLPENVCLRGPYRMYSSPYGIVPHSLDRDAWYVLRLLSKAEQITEIQKISQVNFLGVIVRFHKHPRQFHIDQLYPLVTLNSLKKAVQYLINNEGKLVFCT